MRFRGNAYGTSAYCKAQVKKSFMKKMTTLNEVVVYGNRFIDKDKVDRRKRVQVSYVPVLSSEDEDEEDPPPEVPKEQQPKEAPKEQKVSAKEQKALAKEQTKAKAAAAAVAEVVPPAVPVQLPAVLSILPPPPPPQVTFHVSELTLPAPAATDSFYHLLQQHDRPLLLQHLAALQAQAADGNDMEIRCDADFWMSMNMLKYCAAVCPATHSASALELLRDSPRDKLSWYKPLELQSEALDLDALPLELIEGIVPRPVAQPPTVLDSSIEQLEQELHDSNVTTNDLLARFRRSHIEQQAFWKERENNARDDEAVRTTQRRLARGKRRRAGSR